MGASCTKITISEPDEPDTQASRRYETPESGCETHEARRVNLYSPTNSNNSPYHSPLWNKHNLPGDSPVWGDWVDSPDSPDSPLIKFRNIRQYQTSKKIINNFARKDSRLRTLST